MFRLKIGQKIVIALIGCFALEVNSAFAEVKGANPTIASLGWMNDYSYLRGIPTEDRQGSDRLKFLPIQGCEPCSVSLGGEIRYYSQYWSHVALGALPNDRNDGTQQRLRAYADFKYGENYRAFFELGDNYEYGAEFHIPSNYDAVDISQAFVDFSLPNVSGWKVTLRPGRFNMPLGSGILVGLREGNNVRYTYDGLRAMLKSQGGVSVDVFSLKPTEFKPGSFDDGANNAQGFDGVYVKLPMNNWGLDFYVYKTTNDNAFFAGSSSLRGPVGSQVRRSYGVRTYGAYNGWDYDLEGVFQNGHFIDEKISAWALLANVGYTLKSQYPTRFGLRLNGFSGDKNPGKGRLQTFEPPFPRTAHLSDSGLYALMNVVSVAPNISVKLSPNLQVGPGLNFMWQESKQDAFYWGGNGRPLAKSQNSDSYIGSALNFQGDWSISRNLKIHFYVERLWAGGALSSFGSSTIDYAGVYAQYLF